MSEQAKFLPSVHQQINNDEKEACKKAFLSIKNMLMQNKFSGPDKVLHSKIVERLPCTSWTGKLPSEFSKILLLSQKPIRNFLEARYQGNSDIRYLATITSKMNLEEIAHLQEKKYMETYGTILENLESPLAHDTTFSTIWKARQELEKAEYSCNEAFYQGDNPADTWKILQEKLGNLIPLPENIDAEKYKELSRKLLITPYYTCGLEEFKQYIRNGIKARSENSDTENPALAA